MQDGERRARIVAAVTERGAAADIGELMRRLRRFAVDEMALSGCALVLMSSREDGRVLADAGPRARTITRLQAELGEGPCLQAYTSGVPVLLPDLASAEASRWPAFAAAALAAGLHAEFSLPLGTRRNGIGTLDLCRDAPGMLSDDQLSDALVAAGIARDAVLSEQYAPGGLEALLAAGIDRLVVHQATGMIAAQLDDTVANALARRRSRAGARCMTSRGTWWNGGCDSMNEAGGVSPGRPQDDRGAGGENGLAREALLARAFVRLADTLAAIALIQERALREHNLLIDQLQTALNSRVIIEQAKGMLAEYLAVSVDEGFKL